VRKPT
jgi:hypothetical protein